MDELLGAGSEELPFLDDAPGATRRRRRGGKGGGSGGENKGVVVAVLLVGRQEVFQAC